MGNTQKKRIRKETATTTTTTTPTTPTTTPTPTTTTTTTTTTIKRIKTMDEIQNIKKGGGGGGGGGGRGKGGVLSSTMAPILTTAPNSISNTTITTTPIPITTKTKTKTKTRTRTRTASTTLMMTKNIPKTAVSMPAPIPISMSCSSPIITSTSSLFAFPASPTSPAPVSSSSSSSVSSASSAVARISATFPILKNFASSSSSSSSASLEQIKRKKSPSFIRSHLPQEFIEYADAIYVLYTFWNDNIAPLIENSNARETYEEFCKLLCDNFLRQVPEAGELLEEKNVVEQGDQMVKMLGWLVTLLTDENNASQLILTLRKVGESQDAIGIKAEYYPFLLQAFHSTFSELFETEYNVRVRFCFGELFEAAIDIICHRDFTAKISHENVKKRVMEYITSLSKCLSHPEGSRYLELFMKQQFCAELWSFYQVYLTYKECTNDQERRIVSNKLLSNYLEVSSPMEVNISYETRKQIFTYIAQHDKPSAMSSEPIFPSFLFDKAAKEVYELIQGNIWSKFQAIMVDLCGCEKELSEWKAANKNKQTEILPFDYKSIQLLEPTFQLLLQNLGVESLKTKKSIDQNVKDTEEEKKTEQQHQVFEKSEKERKNSIDHEMLLSNEEQNERSFLQYKNNNPYKKVFESIDENKNRLSQDDQKKDF